MKQLEGQDITDIENAKLQSIDLGLPALKEIGAKWLVDMARYISDKPQFIVNGFIPAGIAGALDIPTTMETSLVTVMNRGKMTVLNRAR